MTSWRDSASQEAQNDLDGLLSAALPLARQLLDEHGEFFPFGASVRLDGTTAMEASDPGQGERPPSREVLSVLVDGLRARRQDLRAAALVADVSGNAGDAVRVVLEHRDERVLAVLLPYKKKRFGRGVEYGPLRAETASAQVWNNP